MQIACCCLRIYPVYLMIQRHQIEKVAVLLAEAVGAERVILFGSHARGEAHDMSDVDLMIVAESDLPRFKRSRALYAMLRPYPFPMDLVVYTPREVERAKQSPLSFVSRVLQEGKSVYVRGT
jgi:uncharacterized protein